MTGRALRVSLLASALCMPAAAALAQFPPPPPPPGAPPAANVEDRWPSPPPPRQQPDPQAQPQQKPAPRVQRPAPAPSPAPAQTDDVRPAATAKPKAAPKAEPRPAANRTGPTTVACNGVFAKDSAHLKLAMRYDSRNLIWGQVDGPEGTKLNASVLFPNDPKRRLEVLWNDEASRSDLQLIAINGQSQWTAPRGLRLGMPLAALEKANGRPFRLSPFGADGTASVLGWDGGALASLPGGCKIGVRLASPAASPELAAEKELTSNNPGLKAAKATVSEILIGY
jgi:hypothetical protein